jgi:glycyl-tRNA synthetase beta chain
MSLLQVEAENSKLETRTKRAARKDAAAQTLPLLLEVGCEEIPARFLRDAEKGLGARVLAALAEARLLPATDPSPETGVGAVRDLPRSDRGAPLQTYSTPRRLVVYVPALLAQQPDKVEDVLGPPVKVAVDAAGKYTRAAESFAQKNSGRLEDLNRTTTPKGEYLSLRKTTEGRPARELLPELLPAAILGLSFPKSMYWTAKSAPRFVRPIRWIVAILGEGQQAQTVDFEILGVKSGGFTFGHRAKGGEPLPVTDFKDYVNKLTQSHVEIDYGRRRERFSGEVQGLAAKAALQLVQDEWLEDWIANSTEWPRPMLGSFDERFLHLPREILITVMRDHQRYFAAEDQQGSLRPYFVAVLNMDSDAQGLIRQGHEHVLAARFRDAEFFWNADQKIPLGKRFELLERVTYHEKLGSYAEKIRRMQRISDEVGHPPILREEAVGHLRRAIELSKCDLTTQMVQEFPELQGKVGGLYARAQREAAEVVDAIYEHYLPQGFEDQSPKTIVGALTSFIDKFDAVLAGYTARLEPTGSNDPFAMRRHAAGIIKVLLEFSLPIDLQQLIKGSCARLDFDTKRPGNEVYGPLLAFFRDRLRYYLENIRGFRYDTVRAVMAAGGDVPLDVLARVEAMEVLRGGEDFEALSAAAKRIRNILAKSASAADWQPGEVAAELLREDQEKELYAAYQNSAAEAGRLRAGRDYRRALEAISTLRPAVDRFFDKVLVMAEDREMRQNRLRLLKKLDELFSGIAHFAEIAERQ